MLNAKKSLFQNHFPVVPSLPRMKELDEFTVFTSNTPLDCPLPRIPELDPENTAPNLEAIVTSSQNNFIPSLNTTKSIAKPHVPKKCSHEFIHMHFIQSKKEDTVTGIADKPFVQSWTNFSIQSMANDNTISTTNLHQSHTHKPTSKTKFKSIIK